jgi:hypothetical protein
MNYLQLVNQVLVRLRENTIVQSQLDSDPFYRTIGAHVNDAKSKVEDSWQWSQLRKEVLLNPVPDQIWLTLPDSADDIYMIYTILNLNTGHFLRWNTVPWNKARYRDNFNNPVPSGQPVEYSNFVDNEASGNQQIALYPPADQAYDLSLSIMQHQPPLVNWDDRLKVPSLPVYSLATALASRERGEVGGAPTSALFGMADTQLSDAIAYDSAKFPEEMDWVGGNDLPYQTNVRRY